MKSKLVKIIVIVGILFSCTTAPSAWAAPYTWDGGGGND